MTEKKYLRLSQLEGGKGGFGQDGGSSHFSILLVLLLKEIRSL